MKEIPLKTVLLVENNQEETRSIREMFRDQGSYAFDLTHVASVEAAEEFLTSHSVCIVLLDLGLHDGQGLEAVRRLRAIAPRVALVLLSGPDGEETAMRAMEEGAQDYLISGQITPRELMRSLRSAYGRKAVEESLLSEKERAQVMLDSMGDAVICTDLSGNLTFMNPIAERMTGCLLKNAAGKPLTEVFHLVDATTHIPVLNPTARQGEQNWSESLPVNCILVRPDGSQIFFEDTVAPIRDREGKITGSVLVFRDVTSARTMAAQIAQLAERDPLTGLPNRLLLKDRIGQAIASARRDARLIAVLFLDLDNFKEINDSLGHLAGDRLLQSVAKRLLECVRTPDTVSRQGGDEFVLLLQGVGEPEDAAFTAKRILKALAETHIIDGHEIHVSASIGVSMCPNDGVDAETLIKHADTAMYDAKASGRHTYRFFRPQMNVRAVGRQSIEDDLRRALGGNEFTLRYQPKVDLKTGAITGVEALLRWTNATRGSVPPSRFISVAEDSSLILPIGAWVLREACTQARTWTDAGLPFAAVSVNVSAMQFRSASFVKDLLAIVAETGMDPRFLELEVTESILMKHPELTVPILRVLGKKGIHVSVDDFGTGYSSLSYLKRFPLDALKIDRSFIRRLATRPEDMAIVSAIISMARNLHLRVVAEGVETEAELAFLKVRHCDEAQGYYFSRPVPAAEFAKMFTNHVH